MRRLFPLLALLGCGDKDPVDTDVTEGDADADADSDTDADTDADSDPTTSDVVEPCFEADIVPIFERSCGTGDDGCHSAIAFGPTPAGGCEGWLSLVDAPLGGDGCPPMDLYTRLTELHGWSCLVNGDATSGFDPIVWNYVTPGDPDTSVLYQKIAPDGILCAGENQVPTQRMPMSGPLSEAEIALVRTWIEQGAKTNAMCAGTTTQVPNAAPVVIIDHPGDGEIRYISAGTYPFVVRATDAEDGDLAAGVVWTSSLEGRFGTGTGFDHVLQPAGFHVVTASVTDSGGLTGAASITIEMRP